MFASRSCVLTSPCEDPTEEFESLVRDAEAYEEGKAKIASFEEWYPLYLEWANVSNEFPGLPPIPETLPPPPAPPAPTPSRELRTSVKMVRGRICSACKKPLVVVGTSRKNGRPHADWPSRSLHKACMRLQSM